MVQPCLPELVFQQALVPALEVFPWSFLPPCKMSVSPCCQLAISASWGALVSSAPQRLCTSAHHRSNAFHLHAPPASISPGMGALGDVITEGAKRCTAATGDLQIRIGQFHQRFLL